MIIYKYQLNLHPTEMHFSWPSSKILFVGEQDDKYYMWVEHWVDPELSQYKNLRRFVVIPTGVDFNGSNLQHVASWIDPKGKFVWHLYEIIR